MRGQQSTSLLKSRFINGLEQCVFMPSEIGFTEIFFLSNNSFEPTRRFTFLEITKKLSYFCIVSQENVYEGFLFFRKIDSTNMPQFWTKFYWATLFLFF